MKIHTPINLPPRKLAVAKSRATKCWSKAIPLLYAQGEGFAVFSPSEAMTLARAYLAESRASYRPSYRSIARAWYETAKNFRANPDLTMIQVSYPPLPEGLRG